jgi:small-conductance mechanosensitive channel
MFSVMSDPWFYWAVGVAIGLPLALIVLTEWQHTLRRRNSTLLGPVTLLRNFLLPLGALLAVMLGATQMPPKSTPVRIVGTLVAIAILVLLLSGIRNSLFAAAPDTSWRRRVPAIFLDVIRFGLIAVGGGLIFAYIWGANVGGLFTALGIGSIVIGLTLQNSVGQIISGLLMLFEQPFRLGDWIETSTQKGRVVEVNWRAVHVQTGAGLRITPNSVLAGESFLNLSRHADRTDGIRRRGPAGSGVRHAESGRFTTAAGASGQQPEFGPCRNHEVQHRHPASLTQRRCVGEKHVPALDLVRRSTRGPASRRGR